MSIETGHVDVGTSSRADVDDALVRAESNPYRPPAAPLDSRRFDTTWPARGTELVRLLVAAVLVAGTGIVVGLVLTDWAAPNSITRLDERLADWFVGTRTDTLTSVATWAAFPANTFPKIIISAIICCFFLVRWRRWDEAVYVALPLVFEATCFVTITKVVQRPRPEDSLLDSTINSSFPSGHVAAATVYVAVAIVVFRHTRAVWARALVGSIFVVVALGVYWARLYQGMHYATDVLAGIVLGIVSVLITDQVLRRRHREPG